MTEIWRDIKGFEGLYAVSNTGLVKSLNYLRTGNERILKAGRLKSGYLVVVLYKDGVGKTFYIHRLVAEAFLPNHDNKPEVDHIVPVSEGGGNELSNLRWCTTHKENCNNEASLRHYSEAKKGEKHPMYGKFGAKHPRSKPIIGTNKTTGEEVRFACSYEAQRVLGIDNSSIAACCRGKLKSAGGYYWYYQEF